MFEYYFRELAFKLISSSLPTEKSHTDNTTLITDSLERERERQRDRERQRQADRD